MAGVALYDILSYLYNNRKDRKIKEPAPRGWYKHADGTLLRKPAKRGRR